MADSFYPVDPEFYTKQVKAQEKDRKKFENASYNSARRGYVIDGQLYTEKQRTATIKSINDEIKRIKGEEKKYGKFGPNAGSKAQGNEAGAKFMELYNRAVAVKVTDFDSALENFNAWKDVRDFVAANPDIKIVATRPTRGSTRRGEVNMKVVIDPTVDPTFKSRYEANVSGAEKLAYDWTEKGTTKVTRVRTYEAGAASTYSNVKTVTDQAELDRRVKAVDAAKVAPPRPAATTTAPTTTTTVAPTTTAPAAPTGPAPSTTVAPSRATGPSPSTTVAPSTTTTTTPAATGAGGLTAEQQAGLRRRGEVAGGMGATRPRPGEPAPTGPAQPATQGGGATTGRGGAGAGAGAGAGTGGRRRVVNWEPKFREMFPAQAWMLDLDRTKYADVFKLFQQAIDQRWYETPEGQDRFLASLKNTSFDKELASTGKARQIRSLVGDLGFDTVPFNKFLTTAMNMGWEGDTLAQEAYKEAFRKDVTTGQYVNPTAVKRVQASTPYLAVKNIGKLFFSTIDDETVEQRLTGALIDDDIIRQQRELAKGKYAHLAPLLDQGLSLKAIASSYQERAAQLLEKDVNDIDMGSADFSQAFNFGEEGKKRMMGDGEWEILLRSDQRFGWRKTQNAKQEATQLASSIAQAFGRVL